MIAFVRVEPADIFNYSSTSAYACHVYLVPISHLFLSACLFVGLCSFYNGFLNELADTRTRKSLSSAHQYSTLATIIPISIHSPHIMYDSRHVGLIAKHTHGCGPSGRSTSASRVALMYRFNCLSLQAQPHRIDYGIYATTRARTHIMLVHTSWRRGGHNITCSITCLARLHPTQMHR